MIFFPVRSSRWVCEIRSLHCSASVAVGRCFTEKPPKDEFRNRKAVGKVVGSLNECFRGGRVGCIIFSIWGMVRGRFGKGNIIFGNR